MASATPELDQRDMDETYAALCEALERIDRALAFCQASEDLGEKVVGIEAVRQALEDTTARNS